MKTSYPNKISYRFHYEMECQRYDCPKDNVCKWLEDQALDYAYKKTGRIHRVDKISLTKQDDGTHTLTVIMM